MNNTMLMGTSTKQNHPFTLSDRYEVLKNRVDERQAKILASQNLRQKVYWQNEVHEDQTEMKAIMNTMVSKGDLEHLPWIESKTENPIIKVKR
jgi:hypothetical protein